MKNARRSISNFDFNNNPPGIKYNWPRLSALGRNPAKTHAAGPLRPCSFRRYNRKIWQTLSNAILRAKYSCDEYHRALYSTDASLYQIQPLAVVVPRIARRCGCLSWRLPRNIACRWSRAAAARACRGNRSAPGIVVDFSKYLNRIVELDPAGRTARVEPGVVLDQLNAAAGEHGLQFGPDVATSNRANIGGMIGNNSAGSRSIRHGKTVDHVVELSVLSADGTPATLRPLTARPTRVRSNLAAIGGASIYRVVDADRCRRARGDHRAVSADLAARERLQFGRIRARVSRAVSPRRRASQRVRRSEAERFPARISISRN